MALGGFTLLKRPNEYRPLIRNIRIQIPMNNSHLKIPQPRVKSTIDKNLKAKATSNKPKFTFTFSNQPPDLGKPFNHCGNNANKVNGKAKAIENIAEKPTNEPVRRFLNTLLCQIKNKISTNKMMSLVKDVQGFNFKKSPKQPQSVTLL